jgi:hypothetical protein
MADHRFWDSRIITRIVESESFQLKELAEIAGLDPEYVLRYGDLRGLDFRGQDLRGIDLANVDLSQCIVDSFTCLDDRRSLAGGASRLTEAFLEAVDRSYDMPDVIGIYRQLRYALSSHIKFLFIVGRSTDVLDIIRSQGDVESPLAIINSSRGYYGRRAALIEAVPDMTLHDSVLDFIHRNFPALMVANQDRKDALRQLELPLRDKMAESVRRGRPHPSFEQSLSNLRKAERITDIWLVVNAHSSEGALRSLQSEVAGLARSRTRLRFLFLCRDEELFSSGWRKSVARDRDSGLITGINPLDGGWSGYLRSISSSMTGNIKFTPQFTRQLNKNCSEWQAAQGAVASAGVKAIAKARKLPIGVGVADLRSALSLHM